MKSGQKEINEFTGLEKYLKASLPNEVANNDKLGYVEINTLVNFPKDYLKKLMVMRSRSDYSLKKYNALALKKLNVYLEDSIDPYRICPANIGKDSLSKRGVRWCRKKLSKDIDISFENINSALQNMYL
ncbi:MAG: hypothetical protein HN576_06940 [Bacteriovoracaceae bacterium]|nr:hypothetical protein [Bacteriovoracaceae bacterium]